MSTQPDKFEIELFSNYGMDGEPKHKYRVTGVDLAYSSNSINKALNAIRKAINPAPSMKKGIRDEEIVKYLSREQTMAFLHAIGKHHDQSVNKSLFEPCNVASAVYTKLSLWIKTLRSLRYKCWRP